MALSMGKPTIVRSPEQAKAIHESVAKGKRLDTSRFNFTPKRSVEEILAERNRDR